MTATFTAPLKLAFVAGLLIAMPYVLYQIWAFVAPGLYRREKRFAMPLLVSAILLFYLGVAFSYFFVFPLVFRFFIATTPHNVMLMADITQLSAVRADAVRRLRRGVRDAGRGGAAGAHQSGDAEKLRSMRGYVLIIVFIIAAILTPPDVMSQTAMAVPMYLLYRGRHSVCGHPAPNSAATEASEQPSRDVP